MSERYIEVLFCNGHGDTSIHIYSGADVLFEMDQDFSALFIYKNEADHQNNIVCSFYPLSQIVNVRIRGEK